MASTTWKVRISVAVAVVIAVAGLGACGNDKQSVDRPTTPVVTRAQTGSAEGPVNREPGSYGDDSALDTLWDSCAAGDNSACDELYDQAPSGSEYEQFGDTCGGRSEGGIYCTELDLADTEDRGDVHSVDPLCEDALSALREVPTSGYDDEDFAIEQYAIAEILGDLADSLASAGAEDLSLATEGYADAASDLALAFEEGQFDTTDEYEQMEAAGVELEDVAASTGARSCQQLASY